MTTTNDKKITDFLKKFESTHLALVDYITTSDIEDYDNAFDLIQSRLEDARAFDIEIIYYHVAMDYLLEHDPSLTDSLDIAQEMGYTAENLNSEVLASLLASQKCREDFEEWREEITEFFDKL